MIRPVQLEYPTVLIQGERGQESFERLMIDSEAFFTRLPTQTLLRIGAPYASLTATIGLDDGRSVESPGYWVAGSVGGWQGATLAITFDQARPVLGSKLLEDLGLRINSKFGILERSRGQPLFLECEE